MLWIVRQVPNCGPFSGPTIRHRLPSIIYSYISRVQQLSRREQRFESACQPFYVGDTVIRMDRDTQEFAAVPADQRHLDRIIVVQVRAQPIYATLWKLDREHLGE